MNMDIKESFIKKLKPVKEKKFSLMVPDVSTQIIKPLQKKFAGRGEVKGYEFSLVSKTKWGFCYEVSYDGIITHYEVFLRKINNRFGCESYPTSKAFGYWAWTFKTKDKAIRKLNSL
jgi:hypothetical protein